jgi:hypothetical protein
VATEAFNRRYNRTLFPLPQPILGQATRVMSLRDGTAKMSKSDPNDRSRINLTDSKDEVPPTSKLGGLVVILFLRLTIVSHVCRVRVVCVCVSCAACVVSVRSCSSCRRPRLTHFPASFTIPRTGRVRASFGTATIDYLFILVCLFVNSFICFGCVQSWPIC